MGVVTLPRNRKSARQAGSWFERVIADHLRESLGDNTIERAPRWGAKDKGDIVNVKVNRVQPVAIAVCAPVDGEPLAIEAKNVARMSLTEATKEARVEALHAEALAGVVVHKRYGTRDPRKQWVSMTVDDLVALITGVRCPPDDNERREPAS